MNNTISHKEAAQAVKQINDVQADINRHSAKEYMPWIGWGLFTMLLYPPFDYFDQNKWSIVVGVVAIVGAILTDRYIRTRQSKVKREKKTSPLAWVIYMLLILMVNVFAFTAHSQFAYAWTITGLAIGLPTILYGLWLKSQN